MHSSELSYTELKLDDSCSGNGSGSGEDDI